MIFQKSILLFFTLPLKVIFGNYPTHVLEELKRSFEARLGENLNIFFRTPLSSSNDKDFSSSVDPTSGNEHLIAGNC